MVTGDREIQGGGGDQRPNGTEELREGEVTHQDAADADEARMADKE